MGASCVGKDNAREQRPTTEERGLFVREKIAFRWFQGAKKGDSNLSG